jgi:hypothetical protein
MSSSKDEPVSQPTISLVIIGLVLLLGLGLYFWLAPSTPVVATPIEAETPP